MFWWWVLVWTVVLLASGGLLVLLGIRVYRSGLALAREVETASDRFARLEAAVQELARPFVPEESAVFDDPARLRRERDRARRRRRARPSR